MRFVLSAVTLLVLAGCGKDNAQPPPQAPPPNGYAGAPYPNNGYPNNGYPNNGAPNTGAPMGPTAMGPGPMGPAPATGFPPPGGSPTPTTAGTAAPGPFGLPNFQMPTGFPPPGGGPAAGPSSGGCQPIDPNFAAPATAALNLVAAGETSGMQREGGAAVGNCQDGQQVEAQVTIQPGKCYTFVAAGVGPSQLQIDLVPAPVAGLPPIGNMGSAKGAGQKTVLGGGGNCIKLALVPVPVPAKVMVRATGQGPVAVQAFSK